MFQGIKHLISLPAESEKINKLTTREASCCGEALRVDYRVQESPAVMIFNELQTLSPEGGGSYSVSRCVRTWIKFTPEYPFKLYSKSFKSDIESFSKGLPDVKITQCELVITITLIYNKRSFTSLEPNL